MSVSPNNMLGKYRIVREIARSNDIVYEAIDPQMNRRVALKELMLPHHLAGAQKRERIERFYREAKAAGTLSHPNIVTIFEVGQENDRHFIAMEYLEGQSLRDILQMQGALPLRETLDMCLQLCEALGYAHGHGVVHRDIKPDNVHILPGGIIKLTDFGIARITAEPSITSQGQVFGTPSYMSPEQVASQNVDHRTDLFSLAITLYEMLTGRKPFTGDSVITITYNIMNLQPTMPVGVPPMLQGILQKALAKDPNLRYQSAAALAADLRAQKYDLDTPAYQKTSQLTFGQAPPDHSYDNRSNNSHMPGQPPPTGTYPPAYQSAGGDYLPYHPPASMFNAQARSVVRLIGSIVVVLLLIALLIWGIFAALHAYQDNSKQQAAVQMEKTAQSALSAGDYRTATNDFQSAQQTAPQGSPPAQAAVQGLASIQVAQGQSYQKANDPQDAQASYQQALSIDSHDAQAYEAQGNLHYQQNDAPDAISSWQQAITADPSSPSAADARQSIDQTCQNLAQTAQQNGNINQARYYWGIIVQNDPLSQAGRNAQAEIEGNASNLQPPPGQTPQ